ncbi:MAG TPA: C1 family peptidase [Bacteroidales bacterium]|nr:C1 family peptidase [Bacteroidales bacterium]
MKINSFYVTLLLCFTLFFQSIDAQIETEKKGYVFTDEIRLNCTPVKNQYRSGTCWSYAGISFIESELLKSGKGEFNLSEAFIVRQSYLEKAIQYVRWHGEKNFAAGGASHDVLHIISKYGIVPEEVYTGLVTDDEMFVHSEMDLIFKNYVDAVIQNKNRKLTSVWQKGFESLLDTYLGSYPEKFTYKGKEYSPRSFADALGLKLDDFIEVGSYTHHPYYQKFIIEIPDNWLLGEIYNVKLDELLEIINTSLDKGHTLAWSADVSERGFSWKNGLAIIPDETKPDLTGTEKERWEALTKEERDKMLFSFNEPIKEKLITQQTRQLGFDNYTTTDDHLMEIIGRAKDQNGNTFYIIKNSWGTDGHIYDGFFYASESYLRYKTIYVMVNKNSIPSKIADLLKL